MSVDSNCQRKFCNGWKKMIFRKLSLSKTLAETDRVENAYLSVQTPTGVPLACMQSYENMHTPAKPSV
jgi:hypothetical protein